MNRKNNELHPDVVLIGAGIMSATLGVFLKKLQPDWTIEIFERLDEIAGESSDAWNNAGTGHSAFCELNYTHEKEDGSIDITKAIKIAGQFETSKEFWATLVDEGIILQPHHFINSIPHMSFVWGKENVGYLQRRHDAMVKHHFFRGMDYTEAYPKLGEWVPLMMKDRAADKQLGATRMEAGTDVNFGALTRMLFKYLEVQEGVQLHCGHEVRDIDKDGEGQWFLNVKDLKTGERRTLETGFLFIGAGGGALPLLEKTGIPEAKGFGGFPVSGQWFVCNNEEVIKQHTAKVYGKASVGAPPMSVPHLDTRMINGKKALLFGPYAGFSTKFLKNGSRLDLPGSINLNNLKPMISAGWHNMDLTKYLLDQVTQSAVERLETLREFVPDAKIEDWDLQVAGQRVQIIKKDKENGGILEFGTEIVSSADGSIAALLGASPGASTAVAIMLEVLKRCFPEKIKTSAWQDELKKLIPSYGQSLTTDEDLALKVRAHTSQVLGLKTIHS